MSTAGGRLAALRRELAARGLHGFIVPRADEHLGEYVPPAAERLAWLTGFTGSAGLAVVLADRAAVFTDGRYVLQLAAQTDPALWERRHITEQPPPAWLAANAPPGARDRLRPAADQRGGRCTATSTPGWPCSPIATNPIDAVWTDRPPPPLAPAVPHPLAYAGTPRGREARGDRRRPARGAAGRGGHQRPRLDRLAAEHPRRDVPFTPFALGFALAPRRRRLRAVHGPGQAAGADPRLARQRRHRGATARRCPARWPRLARQARAGRSRRLARSGSPRRCARPAPRWRPGMDPCLLPKACKNPIEQQGARDAHARDAVGRLPLPALARPGRARRHAPPRLSAADRLLAFRARGARLPRRELPGDLRRRRARRDHPLPRDRGNRPADPPERTLPDRLRRPVPRRHHRHHPHRLDRARRAARRAARPRRRAC